MGGAPKCSFGMPSRVAWNAEIEESGNYEVYSHLGSKRAFFRGRGRGGERSVSGQLHYIVYHDDDEDGEEVILDIGNAEEGWNYLGTFYISSGVTKLELTNNSDGPMVLADAIKWVKR